MTSIVMFDYFRVDFVDSLGRSRRCLKKDLPDLQKQDYELKDRKEKKQ